MQEIEDLRSCHISKQLSKGKFHQQLRTSSFYRGQKEHKDSTNMPGGFGWFGTVSGLKIPFRQLN
ncbi:hypothetical protein DPMN_181743 [Dreissena polymorpha]|uniref:Uncharacterized protein n=1 Tax=Dreissena polymorpha TaxID=45954 RepID=A0A9D4DE45_DREPO|nr:hypothetical protein DPMN_181743 [Dreissena polymorpha]